MYLGNADTIKIESDERGFELWIETDEGSFHFNIHGVAEQLHDAVRADIAPWLRERNEALRTFPRAFYCVPDESGGYDVSDPKHENFHSLHADLWDSREGK